MKFEPEIAYAVVPLAELIELIIDHRGKTPKKLGGDFTDSGVPVISAIHIKNGQIQWDERERYVSPEMFKKWMPIKLRKDDVLLTSEAPLGETALVPSDDDLVLSQRLFAIRCNKESLDPTYFKYFLTSPGGQIVLSDRASGSTVVGIRQAELLQIAVPHPDIKIQRIIGKLLLSLDAKIQANSQLSKTLEDIAQTIFKSWFIDFDPVKAKMAGGKPAGMDTATAELFPDSMEDSELGLIPTGWVTEIAKNIFDISIGRTPPRKEPEWFCRGDEGVPWVSIRDMGTFKTYSNATSEGLTEEAVAKFRVPVVPEGTVLMSFKLTVGKLCISDKPLVTNEAIAHFVIPSDSPITNYFTFLWLANYDMNSLDSTSSIGTATNSGVIKQIRFLIPDGAVVKAFSELCAPIFAQIRNVNRENTSLVEIRDSLLPRLISGELQIPEEMLAS